GQRGEALAEGRQSPGRRDARGRIGHRARARSGLGTPAGRRDAALPAVLSRRECAAGRRGPRSRDRAGHRRGARRLDHRTQRRCRWRRVHRPASLRLTFYPFGMALGGIVKGKKTTLRTPVEGDLAAYNRWMADLRVRHLTKPWHEPAMPATWKEHLKSQTKDKDSILWSIDADGA